MSDFKDIAKRFFPKSEVVYITSDGIPFLSHNFAKAHADKKGLKIETFKKPKNGTKRNKF